MGVEVGHDRVNESLESLEAAVGPFDVDRTTVAVAPSVFERARERAEAGPLDVVVRIWNESGDVLQLREDDRWTLPRRRGLSVDALGPTIESTIETDHAVECTFDGIDRVTVAGVRDRSDPDADPVHRLFAVADASHEAGEPPEGEWRSLDPHRVLVQAV